MLKLQRVHHVAIICSDYERSKKFYTGILGLEIVSEHLRQERNSYKLDLALRGQYTIELFSFNDPPNRVSHPEAAGLRHLAFQVEDLNSCMQFLKTNGIDAEPVRVDDLTGKRFTFFRDPDDLPIELYEK
jgi:glyoxylase I family protein